MGPADREKLDEYFTSVRELEGRLAGSEGWARKPKPGYVMVQAATSSNPFLPDDYVDALRESYPAQLIEAYLQGRFVNLNSGSVYPSFCRRRNHSAEVERPNETLHVGMDFNVLNMTATINVIRDDLPITVAEVTEVRDTPAMAKLLKDRFKDRGHAVIVYPDASGQNTSSKNASESDLSILRQAGFTVRANSRNPSVRDRVNAVNAMLLNDMDQRRWKVNTDRCPVLTEALELVRGAPFAETSRGYQWAYNEGIVGQLESIIAEAIRAVTGVKTQSESVLDEPAVAD